MFNWKCPTTKGILARCHNFRLYDEIAMEIQRFFAFINKAKQYR